ncbi:MULTISPECIES: hypothetical protein [unclassified Cryobacterium]|uniref:hypothetical protein n=1 Tax=unclassified Cryobacterium TaxID=2649013 RepID=UPI002AB401FB|nr:MULTISPECIES: hypothetical protein [unclassified Cryobacterium]MDY7542633.1 hypothetical protein [Cryobacterium sp. 5B3]MEB0264753.1 hypothetical protein [Cryobacterium sp. 10I5]MEB0273725.1 hypothetical protein [Cryobacterium sp. 5B3]
MMTYLDIGFLLGRVKDQDNREVPKSGVLHEDWLQILTGVDGMEDPSLDECLAALVRHRQVSPGVYLEPGHIIANVRILRSRQARAARIEESIQRRAITAPAINLDRVKFEEETKAATIAERIRKGLDPTTGKAPS